MGFDLEGNKPKKAVGDYFRNNAWSWRPLWELCAEVGSDFLTDEDILGGSVNSGYFIRKNKAKKLAKALTSLLNSKSACLEYQAKLEKNGFRIDENSSSKDNICFVDSDGYCFDWENVKAFVNFLNNSEGFRIY